MTPLSHEQVVAYRKQVPAAVEREPMSRHTTFHIGGAARLYVVAQTSEDCVAAVRAAQDIGIPFFIYGGGSNLLVADAGYEGVVIQLTSRNMEPLPQGLRVDAGVLTALAARKAVELGWGGFEWAVTVPGTIGGAVYGNAGCYGGEMKDVVSAVDVYDPGARSRLRLTRDECAFAYRESLFKKKTSIILSVELTFPFTQSSADGKGKMDAFLQKRKDSQPLGSSSCGCVFRNVDFVQESELDLLKRQIDEIPASMLAQKRLGAGWLVDQVGMMGTRVGDMEVSAKHGNFFLNHGHATAEDVLALISFVKMKVRDEFGIQLQEEVQYLGFES